MKKILAGVLLLVSASVLADLPIDSVVKRRLSVVDIYKVIEFKLQDVRIKANPYNVQYSAALEFYLAVEGNICGAEPESLSFSSSFTPGNFSERTLKLFVAEDYVAEPHIMKGCLTYSRSSKTRVSLEINDYVRVGETEEKIFVVPFASFSGKSAKFKVTMADEKMTVDTS